MATFFIWPALRTVIPILLFGLILVVALEYFKAWARRKMQSSLLDSRPSNDPLSNLSWRQFEELLVEVYQRSGFEIVANPKGGADGGVDITLRKGDEITLVQCKRWKDQVGAPVVRELFGVMTDRGAAKGKIVSTGGFTAEAREFAARNRIELSDGGEVTALIQKSQVKAVASNAKSCPNCQSPMVLRERKTDLKPFWGCRQFPKCHGTLPA